MTSDGAIKKLKELQESDDFEHAHSKADSVLCELLLNIPGMAQVVDEYKKITRWCA